LQVFSKKRNTFQAMIISDDHESFAIFNYEEIEWYAATSLGGNPETGTGGKAAKVFFFYCKKTGGRFEKR
jgi:hypothetical protein